MAIRPGWQGRFYEDFEIGDIYQHPLGRTVTEADNVWFTLLTMNTNEMHFNVEVGESSEFKRVLVNSALTISIAIGQSVIDTSQNAFANLGLDKVRISHPVFVGDTLWSESLVMAKRESGSRKHAGIVTIKTRSLNQAGDQVLAFKRTFYVHKRDSNNAHMAFPTPKEPFIASEDESITTDATSDNE